MLLKLSQCFNNEENLRQLATHGLKVNESIIDSKIYNNKQEIHSAALQVLKIWRMSLEDPCAAYKELCDILRSVDMAYFLNALK